MIQIIDENKKRSLGQKLSGAVGAGLDAYSQYQDEKNENEALKKLGIDPSIRDPKMRQEMLANRLKGQEDQRKQNIPDPRTKMIRQKFGDDAADIFDSAPEGGKTEVIKHLLESTQRGENFGDRFKKDITKQPQDIIPENESQGIPNIPEEEKPEKRMKDFDKGLTPKERASRQENRYNKNLPIQQESYHKYQAHQSDAENLSILDELNPKITTMDKFNVNPKTGDLLIPQFASPEAQRFVKTINDFTKNAKDSYGARVTNFDIQQFLKRLPTLTGSEEGRRQIIRQLTIMNNINLAREGALQEVIEEYGGIRNIDYDEAERIADKRSSKEIAGLRKEFSSIGTSLDKSYDREVSDLKKIVPNGHVLVEFEDGSIQAIKKDKVQEFVNDKAGKVL